MLRPDYDTYYMKLAYDVAKRTNCMQEGIGAIIVNKYRRFISSGYNGTPVSDKNCFKGGCLKWNNSGIMFANETCKCIHAEENAIMMVNKDESKGGYIYINSFPCINCALKIVQIGITTIWYDASEIDVGVKNWIKEHKNIKLKRVKPF